MMHDIIGSITCASHTHSIGTCTMVDQASADVVAAAGGSEESRKMCADMFGKVSDYVNGELAGKRLL